MPILRSSRLRTPPECVQCMLSYRSINGLYCRALGRYVQWSRPDPCPARPARNAEAAAAEPKEIYYDRCNADDDIY